MQGPPAVAPLGQRNKRLIAAAMLAQLGLTMPLAAILNTWVDESYTLRTTNSGLVSAVHQALRFELQPPLYFAALSVWRQADHSIFYARLFSVFCAALTIYCAVEAGRRFAPRLEPAWIAVIFVLSPAMIWAALEIRVYALAGLLISVILWSCYDGYLRSSPSHRARIVHVIAAITGLYTQYFIAFVLVGCWLGIVVTRNRWAVRAYVLNSLAVVGAGLPLLLFVREQLASGTASYYSNEALGTIFYRFYSVWFNYVMPVGWAGLFFRPFGSVKASLLVSIAAVATAVVLRKRYEIRPAQVFLGVVVMTVCALLILAFTVTHEPFGTRYAFVVFVPLGLFMVTSVAGLQGRARRIGAVWLSIYVIGSAGMIATTYSHLAKPGDWKRVAHFIQVHERSGQPILAFQTENALTLADYYEGRNAIIAVPRPISFENTWNENIVVQNEGEVAEALHRVPGQHPLVWAVTTNECHDFNVDYHCPVFEHYVATHFSVLLRREFFGSTVRLLQAKH